MPPPLLYFNTVSRETGDSLLAGDLIADCGSLGSTGLQQTPAKSTMVRFFGKASTAIFRIRIEIYTKQTEISKMKTNLGKKRKK